MAIPTLTVSPGMRSVAIRKPFDSVVSLVAGYCSSESESLKDLGADSAARACDAVA